MFETDFSASIEEILDLYFHNDTEKASNQLHDLGDRLLVYPNGSLTLSQEDHAVLLMALTLSARIAVASVSMSASALPNGMPFGEQIEQMVDEMLKDDTLLDLMREMVA